MLAYRISHSLVRPLWSGLDWAKPHPKKTPGNKNTNIRREAPEMDIGVQAIRIPAQIGWVHLCGFI